MARVLGGSFGELRGKLGGQVFSRNRRGMYVRAYAVPVNPNTESQAIARNDFTSTVGGWHTLDDAQKNLWSTYAINYFSSKRLGNLSGAHSGINAFVSLRNTLLNASRKAIALLDLDVDINGTPVTVLTRETIILPTLPPAQPFQPIMARGDYAVAGVASASFSNLGVGSMSFNLNYTGGSGPTPTPPSPISTNLFEDANESNMGIAIFASNPLAQASQFVQNPNLVLISSTGLISGYTTTPAVPATVEINFDASVSTAERRTQWLAGQSVRLDAWMFNSYGESARIGTEIVTVS